MSRANVRMAGPELVTAQVRRRIELAVRPECTQAQEAAIEQLAYLVVLGILLTGCLLVYVWGGQP